MSKRCFPSLQTTRGPCKKSEWCVTSTFFAPEADEYVLIFCFANLYEYLLLVALTTIIRSTLPVQKSLQVSKIELLRASESADLKPSESPLTIQSPPLPVDGSSKTQKMSKTMTTSTSMYYYWLIFCIATFYEHLPLVVPLHPTRVHLHSQTQSQENSAAEQLGVTRSHPAAHEGVEEEENSAPDRGVTRRPGAVVARKRKMVVWRN